MIEARVYCYAQRAHNKMRICSTLPLRNGSGVAVNIALLLSAMAAQCTCAHCTDTNDTQASERVCYSHSDGFSMPVLFFLCFFLRLFSSSVALFLYCLSFCIIFPVVSCALQSMCDCFLRAMYSL